VQPGGKAVDCVGISPPLGRWNSFREKYCGGRKIFSEENAENPVIFAVAELSGFSVSRVSPALILPAGQQAAFGVAATAMR